MRNWLVLLGLSVFMALGIGAAAARADDCPIQPGQYFDADPNEGGEAAIAISVDPSTCFITGRALAQPGHEFDPYMSSWMSDFVHPLEGPPPYDHPYGCPYAPGDKVDVADEQGNWHAGVVDDSTEACAYKVTAFIDALPRAEDVDPYDALADLRPARLKGPSDADVAAARLCPKGGAASDFDDDSDDSMFKRAIIAELTDEQGIDAHVYFEKIRFGTIQKVTERFIGDHPDAPAGGDIYPFRLTASVCTEQQEGPDTNRIQADFDCYYDKFGDFVCRKEGAG